MSYTENVNLAEMAALKIDKSDKSEYADCVICCDKRRVSTWVTCSACNFACCRGCLKKYLLGSNNLTPDCMSCHKTFDFEFLAENTDPDFHNKKYREFRTKLLHQRETSMLPGTQELAIEEKRRRMLGSELTELESENMMLRQLVYENDLKIRNMKLQMKTHVWEQQAVPTVAGKEEETKPKFKYIAHCPKNDCNGYVNEKWHCGLCDQRVCAKCHQPKMSKKEENYVKHVCKKDDVETATLLAKDTKPCPGCSIPIYKISGCPQMFCTSCHTAFDWATGKVETGVIHNPHYYEFQRSQNGGVAPRVRGDVRCGGVPDMWVISQHFNTIKIPSKSYDWLYEARRVVDHIQYSELARYPNNAGEGVHLDLRVKYLLKELDEKKWIAELKKREKKREKDRSVHMVLRMFIDTMGDMFSNLVEAKTVDQVSDIFVGMVSLREYVNQNLQKVGDRFGNKVPSISDKWKCNSVGAMREGVRQRRRGRHVYNQQPLPLPVGQPQQPGLARFLP